MKNKRKILSIKIKFIIVIFKQIIRLLESSTSKNFSTAMIIRRFIYRQKIWPKTHKYPRGTSRADVKTYFLQKNQLYGPNISMRPIMAMINSIIIICCSDAEK